MNSLINYNMNNLFILYCFDEYNLTIITIVKTAAES